MKEAPKKESKVIREERTFTTTRKIWPILWKAGEYKQEGTRSVEVRKAVWIDLRRNEEFFPSRYVKELLKNPALVKSWGWDKKGGIEDALAKELHDFLEGYVEGTRQIGVMYYDKRPRPFSQVELEEELTEAYGTIRSQESVNQQQAEEIENLRKRLAAYEKKEGKA